MEDSLNKQLKDSKRAKSIGFKRVLVKLLKIAIITFAIGWFLGYYAPPCVMSKLIYQMTGVDIDNTNNRVAVDAKPVIFVYGNEGQEVTVSVTPSENSKFTCTYPKIGENNSWTVRCEDDNMLSLDGYTQKFNYLYWEGMSEKPYTIESGFCVKGEDTGKFLNNALHTLGLNDREANEFIVYWLPILESNTYNLISFDTSEYENNYELKTEPVADNTLRVYMTFKGLDAPVEIEAQNLEEICGNFQREGLTIVEWGGSEID